MIIWLFMTVMLLFMWPTVLRVFKMQNSEDYSAKYIFVKIWDIVSCVWLGITSVITDYPNNNPFWSTADPFWISQTVWEQTRIYEL